MGAGVKFWPRDLTGSELMQTQRNIHRRGRKSKVWNLRNLGKQKPQSGTIEERVEGHWKKEQT